MSEKRVKPDFSNLGYIKDSFCRDSSDEEPEPEPELEPKPEPETEQELKQEVKMLQSQVQHMMIQTGTQEKGLPVAKGPPMYHNEGRSTPSHLHQLQQAPIMRGVNPETLIAIRSAILGRRPPSFSSSNAEESTSRQSESDFSPEKKVSDNQRSEIEENNYISRWNQDTELIRLTRRGDIQGLRKYQETLGSSHRCMIEINTLNACFQSPLAIALYHGNQQAIRILLSMGARPDVRLSFGNNCFHIVAENDNQGVTLAYLLEACSNIFSREDLDKMLNSPNMFNAKPIDILYMRMSQNKPDMHQLHIMMTMMESHGARRAGMLSDSSWFPSTI